MAIELPRLPANATAIQKAAHDALMLQEGACNPSGIAAALHEICKAEIANGTRRQKDSPAVRLAVHQLCFIVFGTDPYPDPDAHGVDRWVAWKNDMDACRALLNERVDAA